MPTRPWQNHSLFVCLCLFFASCTPTADNTSLRILGAVSLSNTLTDIAALWEAQGGRTVSLGFDGTSRLATQLKAGAPADVFFAADSLWMDELVSNGVVDAASRKDILGNRLVVVVPRNAKISPKNVRELMALPGQLALAASSVPAGRYARAAFLSAGIEVDALPRILNGDHVRAVLSWVAKGEVDAGVVYATDALVEERVKVAFAFSPSDYPAIVYPAAVVSHATRPEEGAAFLTFCLEQGQKVFETSGFSMISQEVR